MGRSPAALARRNASALSARKAVIAEMNPALKAVCAELQSSLVDRIEDNIRFYHGIGKRVLDIRANPTKYLTEQQALNNVDPFGLLEEAISSSRETLRKAASFAEKYDNDDLKRLFHYRNEGDPKFRLHWGHVVYLLSVPDTRMRMRLEEKAVAELWDPAMLHKEIMKAHGGPRKTGGRPLGIPKSVPSQISQMRTITNLWLRREREVWNGQKHNVFKNILEMDPAKYTPAMLKELKTLRTQWDEMKHELEKSSKVADGVIEQVEAGIANPPSAPAAKGPTKSDAAPTVKPQVASKGSAARAKAMAGRVSTGSRRPVPRPVPR